MYLHTQSWQAIQQSEISTKVFIVPLGSIEQHGHHLPLSTDTSIIDGIAKGLHDRLLDEIILLPTLWCGHSTHHQAFPGTVSVTQSVYQALICDICDSLVRTGARKILLLNGHGGNDVPARYALREVKSRHAKVSNLQVVFASYWALAANTLRKVRESGVGGMGHACEMETSLMLLMHNELVQMDRARRDGPPQVPPFRLTDMQQGVPYYMVQDFDEISETGTVGHPDMASVEKGERFFNGIIEEVTAFVKDFQSWNPL